MQSQQFLETFNGQESKRGESKNWLKTDMTTSNEDHLLLTYPIQTIIDHFLPQLSQH